MVPEADVPAYTGEMEMKARSRNRAMSVTHATLYPVGVQDQSIVTVLETLTDSINPPTGLPLGFASAKGGIWDSYP